MIKKNPEINRLAVISELRRRQEAEQQAANTPVFDFVKHCFPAQVAFFRGEGPRFRSACCSRRAGKTVGIAADALETCRKEPGIICLYITVTKQAARNIIWADVLGLIEKYEIKCKVDNTRLTVTFPNRSKFVIEGAKDRSEIEKYRGWKLRKCYIDEAQSFRSYIQELVNDVVTPALRDQKGELYITGTPGKSRLLLRRYS